MEPPKGFIVPENHVLLLRKSLYGLKQAGRQWYKRLRETIAKFDLKPLANDPHTYVTHKVVDGIRRTLILPVYVDDLFPIGDKVLCDEFEKLIPEYFKVTISGDISLFLGIRVLRNRTADVPWLSIDQETFANDTAFRFQTDEEEKQQKDTPYSSKIGTLTSNKDNIDRSLLKPYQICVGSLMYLMHQ